MAQPKRKTESRRAARRQAGRRVPVSNVAGRLVIMLALVAAVVFGVAVFFKVSRVEVQGNSLYSAEQVVQASGIETGDNLLTLNKATVAGNIITQLPYVEKVSVGRSMPDAVILEVQESTARFAVMSDTNVIWLINSSGKALERYDGLTDVTAAQHPPRKRPPIPLSRKRLRQTARRIHRQTRLRQTRRRTARTPPRCRPRRARPATRQAPSRRRACRISSA